MNQVSTEVRQPSQSQALVSWLEGKQSDFNSVMLIDPDRFMRMVKNAIIKDPQVAEASKQSVFLEIMKAAADGLVLDGREATLTRFKVSKQINGKWEKVTEVAYIPMVAGIMKRVRNSGEIKSWIVGLVYEKEYEDGRFSFVAAPDPMLRHEPIIVGDRGPVVAAYSAVKLNDGSYHYEVMTLDQLNNIKNRTKSKKTVNNETVITGPWATDEEEMFKKTVIRRHSKRLPVSSELLDVTQRVDALYDEDREAYVVDPSSGGPEPAPVAAKRQASAAARLKQAAAQTRQQAQDVEHETAEDEGDPDGDEVPHDEDGVVLDGEVIEPTKEDKPAGRKAAARTVDPNDEF